MDPEAKKRIRQAQKDRKRKEEKAKEEFEAAIATELRNGTASSKDVAKLLNVHYETVRRLARNQDVPRLRAPTVTARHPVTDEE